MPAVHQQPSTSPIGARVRFSPAGSILDDQLVRGPRNEGPATLFDAWYGDSITLDDLRLLLPAVWQDAERPTQNLPSSTWVEWFRMVGWTATDDRPPPAEVSQIYRGATWGRRRGMSWTPDLEVAQWFADRFIGVDGGESAHVFQCQVPADAVMAFVEERKGEPEYVIDPRRLPPLGRSSIITPAGVPA